MRVEGVIVDVPNGRFVQGYVEITDGKISSIQSAPTSSTRHIIPGFVDAHVHTESSMVPPSAFSQKAISHGTISVVCDPHEIANVAGAEGIRAMMENAANSPMKFGFGVPSCVPATPLDEAGAVIDSRAVEELLKENFTHLSEVMNYPGAINRDAEVMSKIAAAKKAGKPVDGHAPGLSGDGLKRYVEAGIQTDHECFSRSEAEEKLSLGMKVIVREGSAAKNYEELFPLTPENFSKMMFCSDDLHPDDLMKGHINLLVQRAIDDGLDPMKALQMASVNPVEHYKLPVGLLQEGDPADFIVVNSLTDLSVQEVYIDGVLVSGFEPCPMDEINQFLAREISPEDIVVASDKAIEARDGQLVTGSSRYDESCNKIVCLDRYRNLPPSAAWIKNFDLSCGAIASSVAHDSHNIVAVGADEADICSAVNAVVQAKGGLAAAKGKTVKVLPLPVAGLMSNAPLEEVAEMYEELSELAKSWGCKLTSPFMTLSFMSLLVIPELKLGAKGLFDVEAQKYL